MKIVHRENRCHDCGRQFILEYDADTGRAQQTWQRGCKTMDECVKKYMPKSDFKPYPQQREPS